MTPDSDFFSRARQRYVRVQCPCEKSNPKCHACRGEGVITVAFDPLETMTEALAVKRARAHWETTAEAHRISTIYP